MDSQDAVGERSGRGRVGAKAEWRLKEQIMRAIRFEAFGDPSVLHVAEVSRPGADERTAVVRVMAASINPSDVKNVAGAMKQTTLPRILGRDYAGVVESGPAEWIGAEVWGTGGDVGFTRDGIRRRRGRSQ